MLDEEQVRRRVETEVGQGLEALAYAFGLNRYVEGDASLRGRIRETAAGKHAGSVAAISDMCDLAITESKPLGVSNGEARRAVAVFWLKLHRPRGWWARTKWWVQLWWGMR
jgi:hypothetical protein